MIDIIEKKEYERYNHNLPYETYVEKLSEDIAIEIACAVILGDILIMRDLQVGWYVFESMVDNEIAIEIEELCPDITGLVYPLS